MTVQSSCRSCDAPIVWCTTERGKSIPIDPDPHPSGNVVPHHGDTISPGGMVVVLGPLEVDLAHADGRALWRSHFASCEDADQWRRR